MEKGIIERLESITEGLNQEDTENTVWNYLRTKRESHHRKIIKIGHHILPILNNLLGITDKCGYDERLEKLTPIEKKLGTELFIAKIPYIPQKQIICGKHIFIVDFLVGKNLIVECDGFFYHKLTTKQIRKDKWRDALLTNKGYTILHFNGSKIYDNVEECVGQIIKILR